MGGRGLNSSNFYSANMKVNKNCFQPHKGRYDINL